MGGVVSAPKAPPPPMVLVPPLFDFPPLAARNRMLEPSYNLLFGKLALRSLFEDYFDAANHFSSILMLKPIDDRHVDLIATVSGPLDNKPDETIVGNALFRWKSDADDPHTFTDLYVSSSDPILLMRACAYYPRFGLGAFGIFPVLKKERVSAEDYGTMGLRYGTPNLSVGATFVPYTLGDDFPKSAWLVTKMGRLTAGVKYDPQFEKKDGAKYKNLKNWNGSIGYGLGSGSPLSPSFNFGLEFAQNSQFIASFFQHVVVQRKVNNPFEENEVIGITNYIDFGFELLTRMDDQKGTNNIQDSTFNIAASWQANKNILLKGKVGPLSSALSFSFKSWWKPSFSFSVSAIRDRAIGKTSFGFGLRVDNVREASYQRADPNFVMLTPSKAPPHITPSNNHTVAYNNLFKLDGPKLISSSRRRKLAVVVGAGGGGSTADESSFEMSYESALKLLGVSEGASFDDILRAKNSVLASCKDDQDSIAQVEAAYDMLLMQSLSQRRAGKVVNSSIRYADVKPVNTPQMGSMPQWVQGAFKNPPVSVESPSARDLGIEAGVYGALAVLTYVNGASSPIGSISGADVPGLILASSFGASLYFMTKRNVKLGKATVITIGGLVAGAVVGSAVESWLQVDIVPFLGIHSPATVVSEFVLISQFLVSLYLS